MPDLFKGEEAATMVETSRIIGNEVVEEGKYQIMKPVCEV